MASPMQYIGSYGGSGPVSQDGFTGSVAVTGMLTAFVTVAQNGTVSGTWSYSGSVSVSGTYEGEPYTDGYGASDSGTIGGTLTSATFTSTSSAIVSALAQFSADGKIITGSGSAVDPGFGVSVGVSGQLNGLPPVVQFQNTSVTVDEGGTVTLTLQKNFDANVYTTVHVSTAETLSANAGTDFTPIERDVVFAPGEMSKTITLTILQDGAIEANELVTVRITPVSFANTGATSTQLVTIRDDDPGGSINGNSGNNTLNGNAGNNVMNGAAGNDTMNGGAGNDTMNGGIGNDSLNGGAGNDRLNGDAGNDTLNGGAGNDTMAGGLGNDVYVRDAAGDVINEAAGQGNDLVQSAVTYTLGANLERLTLTGTGNINGTGNALNNVINGNAGNNVLNGGGGVDTLRGMGGNDTLIWNAQDALFDGGTGIDTLRVTGGNLNLTTIDNTKILNVEQINLTGGGNNVLTLNTLDVLALSTTTNVLKVLGDAGDSINIVPAFADQGVSGNFHRYTFGGATLLVELDITSVS